jgi:hypothetical protein
MLIRRERRLNFKLWSDSWAWPRAQPHLAVGRTEWPRSGARAPVFSSGAPAASRLRRLQLLLHRHECPDLLDPRHWVRKGGAANISMLLFSTTVRRGGPSRHLVSV